MTAAQRATLEAMAGYAEQFARRADRPSETHWHQTRADALRAALGTCGNCAYATERLSSADRYTFCAAPNTDKYQFLHKQMPLGERCTGWTAKEGA